MDAGAIPAGATISCPRSKRHRKVRGKLSPPTQSRTPLARIVQQQDACLPCKRRRCDSGCVHHFRGYSVTDSTLGFYPSQCGCNSRWPHHASVPDQCEGPAATRYGSVQLRADAPFHGPVVPTAERLPRTEQVRMRLPLGPPCTSSSTSRVPVFQTGCCGCKSHLVLHFDLRSPGISILGTRELLWPRASNSVGQAG